MKIYLFAALLLISLPGRLLAGDWAVTGGEYYMSPSTGDGSKSKVISNQLKVNSVNSSEINQACYLLELSNRDAEAIIYCEKSKSSPFSETVYVKKKSRGKDQIFKCVNNCTAQAPQELKLSGEQTD